jgi:hypothetical protein
MGSRAGPCEAPGIGPAVVNAHYAICGVASAGDGRQNLTVQLRLQGAGSSQTLARRRELAGLFLAVSQFDVLGDLRLLP